jgi:ribosomal protein S18 acetylase RimI-like enzyme
MNIEITQLGRSQVDATAELLANAFSEDPIYRYLFPESERSRANNIRSLFKLVVIYSQPFDRIYTTTGTLQGIAAWEPPKHSRPNLLQLLPLVLALPFQIGWRNTRRISMAFSKAEELRNRNMSQPHWYLIVLGVLSNYQGQGIGGRLLEPVLKQADLEGYPCYLETSTEGAVRFYQRHGFEVIATERLLENAPLLWMMKREPKNSRENQEH